MAKWIEWIKKSCYYIVPILLLLTSVIYVYYSASSAPLDLSQRAEASTIKLTGEAVSQKTNDDEPEQDNDELDDTSTPEETPPNDYSQQEIKQPAQDPNTTKKNAISHKQQSKPNPDKTSTPNTTTNTKTKPPKKQPNPQKPETPKDNYRVVDHAEEANRYFVTTIKNNEVVTEPAYYVKITHLDKDLVVKDEEVLINGKAIKPFQGELLLQEGKNSIRITVLYQEKDKEPFYVVQEFIVHLNTTDIVIQTNLANKVVHEEQITFVAQAKIGKKKLPLTVEINGENKEPLGGATYKTTLKEGKNQLVLKSAEGKLHKEERFIITFNKEKQTIHLETNLHDQRVSQTDFSFYAQASADGTKVNVQVKLNGEVVSPTKQNQYAVTLLPGKNTIQLEGTHQAEQLNKQYIIFYQDPNGSEGPKEDPLAPIVVTDLVSGSEVQGSMKNININAQSSDGSTLYERHMKVSVNDKQLSAIWTDDEKTSYRLILQEGENIVKIKVQDDNGRTTNLIYTVYSKLAKEDGYIGDITISVEASTIGIPYLIPPTKVPVYEKQEGSILLDKLLKQHGFTYSNTGNIQQSFYIARIAKPNMLQHVAIPQDLWDIVQKEADYYSETDYDVNSLGEMDFTNGAGWMYSINDVYPNYGFSDARFLDGDVVRIRYTLYYGQDINGFGGLGNSYRPNWPKEW